MANQDEEHDKQNGEHRNLEDLYEQMSSTLKENLERAGSFTEERFEKALHDSREWAGKLRNTYQEDVNKVAGFLRRDWLAAVQAYGKTTRKTLDLDRWQAGALGVLSRVAKTAGSQLESFATRINERLQYKTGEIAGPGALACTKCGQTVSVDKPTRIPPCPKCHNTLFRRTF